MSRKIIRRLLTEAVQGSEIKIQRMPSIGYLIVNDQGAETVAKDEVDLMNILRSFKEIGVQSVNDAISGNPSEPVIFCNIPFVFCCDVVPPAPMPR